ncbi:MAG: serine/threonine protein kinase, partial [Planctomycetia bacterium]|nr:serine/threonine protein kinase [Planctomycetia bacterium]
MTTRPPDVDARRLVEIVGEAAALAEADRPAFLDRACGSDERLRQEAESLLVWAARTTAAADDVFREAVGREAAAWVREDDEVAPVVPGFRVVRELARGGMGVVYEAEQDRPRRTVALKVLRRAVADDEHRRRFDREAEVLARLEHPGIARIYGVITATDAAGERPCIVMERVVGVPITEHAARAALPWRARALLAAEVAEALQHAHARGIVHRDVKPANVLVDGSGRPRVVDLGIALEDLGAAGAVARPAGTLPYASPEQLRGPADAVDVRTDVYGLGMLTYELLAGRPALDVIGASTDEALRRAVEMVPVPLGAVDARLNGDVELVVARAVAKGPDARYPTVQAFADDLRRCVRDEPVSVRPPTAGYLLRKLVARHRGVTLAVSMLAASLVVGIVVALGLARAEARARTRSDALAQAADAARRGMATSSYRAMIVAAQAALLSGDADAAASFLETTDPAARGFEWRWLRAQVDASEERYGPADGLEDATPIAVAALGDPGTVVVLWRRPVGGEPTFLLERRRLGRGPRQIVPLGAGWIGALAGDGRAAWVASHQKVTRFDVPPEGSGAVVPGVTVEVGAPVVALAAPRTANGPVAAVAGIDGRSEVRLLRHDGTVGPGWRLPADRSEFAVRSDGLGVVVGTGAGDAVHLDASGARALGWHGPSIASIAV